MPGGGGGGARTFHFSTGGGNGAGFSFSNPESIFSEFLRAGAGGMGGGGGAGGDDDDFMSQFTSGGFGGSFGGAGGRPGASRAKSSMNGLGRRAATPEVTVVERPLPVTLEDLFSGTTKKLKIKRKTYDERTQKQSVEDRILEVPIKKGLKPGSKIKFNGVGDQVEGGTQDLHFIVQEKAHPLYRREGDDLRHDVEITLKEALTGWQRTVTTIDGKQFSVGASGPTASTYTDRFPEKGMPKSKRPDERGDFFVGVNIKFPGSLTAAQKEQLKQIL